MISKYVKVFKNSSRVTRSKEYFWDIFVNTLIASYLCPLKLRGFLLRLAGLNMGKRSAIHGNCYFSSRMFVIGRGSYINKECFIDNPHSLVTIGEKCSIGYRVTFLTSSHDMSNSYKRGGVVEAKEICIGNGVWIGANSIILSGVTIGDGAVIAAGAVVTKDCNPNSLYVGIPTRKIRDL